MIPAGLLEAARVTLAELGEFPGRVGDLKWLRMKYPNPLDFINNYLRQNKGTPRSLAGAAYRVAGLYANFGQYMEYYAPGQTIDRRLARTIDVGLDQYDPTQPYRYEVGISAVNPRTGVRKEWGVLVHSGSLLSPEEILSRGLTALQQLFVSHYQHQPGSDEMGEWEADSRITDFARFTLGG